MGWMYRFVELNDEEKSRRRELLDYYGSAAQISAVVPLLLLQVYFLLSRVYEKWEENNSLERPSSPYLKRSHIGGRFGLSRANAVWRRFRWWSSTPFKILGWRMGSHGEVLLSEVWSVWLLFLCWVQTGDDYLHLTKRFGIVGASQLPLLYMLSMKSPWSPLQMLTRCSHETLNGAHQIFGRQLICFFYLHGMFYFNMWLWKGVVAVALAKYFIWFGIAGLLSFTVLGTAALNPVRRWNYRVFYATHATLAAALPLLLWWHVSHIRLYVYEAFAVYVFNAILRQLNTHKMLGTVKLVPNTNLLEIIVEVPRHTKSNHYLTGRWQVGQHAYIAVRGNPFLRTFRSNPFSVASVPDVDKKLMFYARILDGNTLRLAQNLSEKNMELTIEGPYGATSHANALLKADRVLMVAGGVGATFIVPLYRQLLADLSPSSGSHRRQKVSFVWIARTMSDVSWALPSSSSEREGFSERLEVYLTRDGSERSFNTAGGRTSEFRHGASASETEDGIEMEEHKQLLSDNALDEEGTSTVQATYGRPNLARVVEQTFSQGLPENVAIVVCGPNTISRDMRKEVGKWVREGRKVWFWDENFGL